MDKLLKLFYQIYGIIIANFANETSRRTRYNSSGILKKLHVKMPSLKHSGFTLIEIIIVCAIIAILAAMGIPNILRNIMAANETNAKATLRSVSTACENYFASHNGVFPEEEDDLIGVTPPYLNHGYDGKEIRGYKFSFDLDKTGYTLTAEPVECGRTGTKIFSISPTAHVEEEECSP